MSPLVQSHRRFLQHVNRNGTPITLQWVTVTNPTTDPTTGEVQGTETLVSAVVKGLVHYVAPTFSSYRQYAEVQQGDCLVDFPDTVSLDNKAKLTFVIDGQRWVQARIGTELARYFDTIVGTQRLCRTVLLRRQT